MKRRLAYVGAFVALVVLLFEGTSLLLTPPYREAIGDFKASRFLFLGSSHTRAGIDAPLIAEMIGEPVAKIGLPGATTRDKAALLESYIEEYGAPEYLFYEIGALMFDEKRFVGSSFQQLYPLAGNGAVSHYLAEQDTWTNYWLRKLIKPLRFNGPPWVYAIRQLAGLTKFSRERTLHGETDIWERKVKERYPSKDLILDGESLELLERTLQVASDHHIRVFLVYLPESYLLTHYFDFDQIDSALVELQKKYGAGLINHNDIFEMDNGMFADVDHLNTAGRVRFSGMLAESLKKLSR